MASRSQEDEYNSSDKQDDSNLRKRKYPFDYTSSSQQFSDTLHTTPARDIFPTYEKTHGTGHLLGSEYQYLMCAFFALKFCCDDRIYDFRLTTNNNKYKVFDDITINVKLKDETNIIFVFQLKHGEPQRNLSIGDFARQTLKNKSFLKNPYCLTKHIDFIKTIHESNVICILFTNNTTSLTDDLEIKLETNKVTVKQCDHFAYKDLLVNTDNTKNSDIFNLKIPSTQFTDQFYLFTNQDNVYALRLTIEKLLKRLVKSDIYSSFDHFMRNWWAGNFVLTKTDVITKLTELSLSPLIKTISGECINQKSKQLSKCILNFDITIVDCCEDGIVAKIWEDAGLCKKMIHTPSKYELLHFNSNLTKVCLAALKFGLTAHAVSSGTIDRDKKLNILTSLSDTQISKVLWYLDIVPLIVKVDDNYKEQIESVLQLLEGHFKLKKFVFLVQEKFQEKRMNWNVFHTLGDLISSGNKEQYMYIVNNFYVSLQGKQVVVLKDFLQVDETTSDLFRVKELLQMTQKTLHVGKAEKLPDFYISRSISAIFVDTQKLLNNYSNSSNTLLIINCEKRYEFILKIMPTVELSVYLTNRDYDKIHNLILLATDSKCTVAQFDAICQISNKSVYLFQTFNEKSVFLLKKGDASFLEDIQREECNEDVLALKYFSNPLNYVCAPVGMGKSTLFTVLSRNTPPNLWSVYVNLRDHSTLLKGNSDDVVMKEILDDNEDDSFLRRFKSFLLRTRKLYLFLDEIDHIKEKNLEYVLNFVRRISSEGASVWLSSRDHLQKRITETLSVVPLQIVELNEQQQKKYLQASLETKYSNVELERIVDVIFRSVNLGNSRNLLQFPLSLDIITQVFSEDRTFYEKVNRENMLALSFIYKWLFDGIVKFFCKKLCLDESDQLEYLTYYLERYQIYSLKHCLKDENFSKLQLNLHLIDKFMNNLETKGDKLGIVRRTEPQLTFVHQRYAEYFSALWMSEHLHFVRLLQQEYFSEKDESLRFIFDIILAEENPSFLSIIYRNQQEVHENFDWKDRGGRSLLHLACSYGTTYPISCTFNDRVSRESETYVKFIEQLFGNNKDISECDELFNFTCFSYAIRSRCLYPMEKLLKICTNREEIDSINEIFNTTTLAYYASQLGYPNLLHLVLEKDSGLVSKDFGGHSLLELTVLGSKDENYTFSREGNVKVLKILLQGVNHIDKEDTLNKLLDLACKHGCYDMMKVLVDLSMTSSTKGSTILHQAANYGTLNKEMLTLCKQLGFDVNTLDAERKSLFDIAFEEEDLNFLTLLLKEDVFSSPASERNLTPLHYAVMSNSNMNVIDKLLKIGVDTNARNSEGLTAFELAKKVASEDYVDLLIKVGLHRSKDVVDWKKEESQLSSNFQNNLSFGNTSGEKMETEISRQADLSSSERTFHRRPGTIDMGRDYPHLVIANLVLKLITDNNVKDFQLSADDSDYGYFDDIVLSVKTDKDEVTYAIQLKHSAKKRKRITKVYLAQSKGMFSLTKYFESFQELHEHGKFCDFIVFTNWEFGLQDDECFCIDKNGLKVNFSRYYPSSFLTTSESDDVSLTQVGEKNAEDTRKPVCYKFEAAAENSDVSAKTLEDYQNFFAHFFLFTNQQDVFEIKKQTLKRFVSTFKSDEKMFYHFTNFIKKWTLREGENEKLDKKWMQDVISLLLTIPFAKPLSFEPINYKMKLLQKAILDFSVSIFEEETYDYVKRLLGDLRNDSVDLKKVNQIIKKYQLAKTRYDLRKISDLDDILFYKIMWLQGKCPLIVTEHPSVLAAIELCPHQKFILLRKCPSVWHLRSSVFQNLSDLNPESETYKEILKTFEFSIQGKKEISLGYLVEQDDSFSKYVTSSDLVKMVGDNYQVGYKEHLPDPYIPRFLSKNIFSSKYLETVDFGNTFILISCLHRNDEIQKYSLTDVSELDKEGRSKYPNIYYSVDQYPLEEFEKLCISGIEKYHHFKSMDRELEWLQSKGEISDLDAYRVVGYFAEEKELFDAKFSNKINIISGEPGIGKTQLLNRLKNEIQSLAVIIHPADISYFCSNREHFVDILSEMMDFIIEKFDRNFEKEVVKMLMKKNQVVYLWDGLDELSFEIKKVAIDLINTLSKEDCTQWIACRGILEKELQQEFSVFARHLRPFNENELNIYIQKRLQSVNLADKSEEVADIMSTLRLPKHENVFGFPLQISLLTDLLTKDEISWFSKSKLSLVEIYRQFIDHKYDIYFSEKLNINMNDNVLRQVFESHKNTLLDSYEKTALRILFSEDFLKNINVGAMDQKEDPFGFIVETKDGGKTFIHSSFAEYFAASYLQKHYRNIPDMKIIFDEKYANVRFFFDLLLANNSNAHLAVLYKNKDLLEKLDDLRTCKDSGGRSPLHLAASWGKSYPLLNVTIEEKNYIINDQNEDEITKDDSTYMNIILFLLDKCNVSEVDDVFKMTPLSYSNATNCIFAKIKLLLKENKNLSTCDNNLINILFYSAKLGYDDILDLCTHLPFIVTEKNKDSLLHLAVEHKTCFNKLLKFYNTAFEVNFKNREGKTPMHLACEKGYGEIVQMLLEREANFNIVNRENMTPLQVAIEKNHNEIVDLLIKFGK